MGFVDGEGEEVAAGETKAEGIVTETTSSTGLSFGQKLFGLGVIGGLVFLFVRSRSSAEKWDKTMA